MLDQAIKKLQDEIEKSKDNPAIKAVGEFLLTHLKRSPSDAEKILVASKTIAGAMDDMKSKAQKKQKNGYAVIAPEEGFKIVMDYFGIKSEPKNDKTVSKPVNSVPASKETVPKPSGSAFDIDLDDLL